MLRKYIICVHLLCFLLWLLPGDAVTVENRFKMPRRPFRYAFYPKRHDKRGVIDTLTYGLHPQLDDHQHVFGLSPVEPDYPQIHPVVENPPPDSVVPGPLLPHPQDGGVPLPVPVAVPLVQTVTKQIPVPVAISVPKPYPVEVEKIVHVDRPIHVPVHVDRPVPYPVHVAYPVEKVVRVDRPFPVHIAVPYHVPKPYPVPVTIQYRKSHWW